MPGKYPLITAPTRVRSILEAGGTDSLSQSDTATLRLMFPNSPIYYSDPSTEAVQTDEAYRALAAGYLQPEVQTGDADQFPDGVNMDYAEAPDLSIPPAGFDSSYYPNLIANPDPSGGEGTATGTVLSPNDNFGTPSGINVTTVLPSATSAIINQTTINVTGPIAPSGQSGANTATGTVTTHSINEGADGA